MPSHARCCSPALPLHRHRAPNNAVACPLPPLPPFPLLMPRQRLSMGVAMPPPRQPRGRSPSPSPPPSTAAHCPPMPPQQRHSNNAMPPWHTRCCAPDPPPRGRHAPNNAVAYPPPPPSSLSVADAPTMPTCGRCKTAVLTTPWHDTCRCPNHHPLFLPLTTHKHPDSAAAPPPRQRCPCTVTNLFIAFSCDYHPMHVKWRTIFIPTSL